MAMRRDHTNVNEDERIESSQNSLSFDDANHELIRSLHQSILRLNINDQVVQSRSITQSPYPIADLVLDDDSNSEEAYLTAEDTDGEIEYEEHIEEVGSPNSSTLEASRVLQWSSSPQSSRYYGLLSNVPDVSMQMDVGNSSSGTSSFAPAHLAGSSTRPQQENFDLCPRSCIICHPRRPQGSTESMNPWSSTTLHSLARMRMEEVVPSSHVLPPGARRYDMLYTPRTTLHDYDWLGQMSGVRSLSRSSRQPPSLGDRGTLSTERWPTNSNTHRPTNLASSFSSRHDQGPFFGSLSGATPFGHIPDTLEHVQARSRNLGFNYDNPGSSNYQSRYQPRRFGVPQLEMMNDEINTSRQTFEVPALNRYQDYMLPHPITQIAYQGLRFGVEPPSELSNVYHEIWRPLLASGGTGLAEETIAAKLRQRNYQFRNREPSADVEICPICKEDYADQESIGTLDCNHEFHTHCITAWLKRKNKCPICRRQGLDCSQS